MDSNAIPTAISAYSWSNGTSGNDVRPNRMESEAQGPERDHQTWTTFQSVFPTWQKPVKFITITDLCVKLRLVLA